jgi:hypothetical protein
VRQKYKIVNRKKKKIFRPNSLIWLLSVKVKSFFLHLLYFFYEIFFNIPYYIKLFSIKNYKKKSEAIILAGGPSVDRVLLSDLYKFKLKKNDIFVVNKFYLNKKFKKLIPNYLVLSDYNSFNDLKNNFFLNYIKKTKIICPLNQIKFYSKIHRNPSNLIGFIDAEWRYIYNNSLPIFPRGYISSTTFKALSLAVWMGYKKIYVIGLDQNYLQNLVTDKKNRILQIENHAGETIKYVNDFTNSYGDFSDYIYEHHGLFSDLKFINYKNNIFNLDFNSFTPGIKKIKTNKFRLKKC